MTHHSENTTGDDREALIREWANVHQGPNAHAVLLEMLPIGDQMSLALQDALRELAVLRLPEAPSQSANISTSYAYREGYESGFRDGELGEWRGDGRVD